MGLSLWPTGTRDEPVGEFVHHYRDKWGICRNIITHYLGYKYTVMLAIDPLETVDKINHVEVAEVVVVVVL